MSPEERIEEAIFAHERADWGQHDGWWECTCGEPRTPAHVAAAVAQALQEKPTTVKVQTRNGGVRDVAPIPKPECCGHPHEGVCCCGCKAPVR
jgi:hypothetical protein